MGSTRIVIALLIAVSLLSCARLNSIHRSDHLPWFAGKIIHTDAKQRAVIAVRRRVYESGELAEQYWQFCTEPPPDVFSALASSLSARGSLSESADPISKDVAAELSAALSENAASIERTQTVNILRESMYRTCERFLSGGIGSTEFIVQSARDQRAIVAVLAIEQLTGVQKSQATALTTVAQAASGGVSEQSLEILDNAKTKADDAKEQAAAKRSEAEESEPADIDCAAANESNEAEHATKKALCEAAESSEEAQARTEAYFATVRDAIENQSSLSADTRGDLHTAALNGSEASQHIATRVVEIVRDINNFDELGMTCVVLFRLAADSKVDLSSMDGSLKEACLERIKAALALSAAEKNLEAVGLEQQTERIKAGLQSTLTEQAQVIWQYVLSDGSVSRPRLERLIPQNANLLESDINAMTGAPGFEQFRSALGKVTADLREDMAAAVGGAE